MEYQLQSSAKWNLGRKFSFRFFFALFSLFIFPFPLNVIPWLSSVMTLYGNLWTWMINLVGKHIFGIQEAITLSFTGSEDKLYDWLMYFTVVMLAVIIGIIWSVLDRKSDPIWHLQCRNIYS